MKIHIVSDLHREFGYNDFNHEYYKGAYPKTLYKIKDAASTQISMC